MKIKATFTGEDGSMGFRTGEEYEFELFQGDTSVVIEFQDVVCPYRNLNGFLRNWSNISKI